MLEELRISGLGVIDEAVLPLGPGFTVLTGETGAGKTMLVTALLLLFGGRGDAARVRTGSAQASVDGRLTLAESNGWVAARVTDAGGALDEDGALLLRRVVTSTGRSRAFVGGAPLPVGVLGELSARLLAVHGQSDQVRLAQPAQHRAALDRFAGVDLADYTEAFRGWREATQRLADRTARARELRREAELLVHGIAEIDAAAPQPGEDVGLAAESSRLGHVDGLRLAARAAHDGLLGDPDDPAGDTEDVVSLLARLNRTLAVQAGADAELDELAKRLDGLAATAADLGADLAAYRDGLDADPSRLAEVEARRAVLGGLVRRYGDGGDDLAAVLRWHRDSAERLAELDVSDETLAALAAERDRLARQCAAAALAVSTVRTAAAGRLAADVTTELTGLAMPSAQVSVEVRPRAAGHGSPLLTIDGRELSAGPEGVDDVEILLRPHPASPTLPLSRGASGGELSRVMLALEVCLTGTDPVPTLIFDEVDAGVGGRAAVEVGRRLAALAKNHQVIVVTHLAQVAAFADRQVVIDKPLEQAGVTRSGVRLVEGDERIAELARMLAGSDSPTAREHAAELLASAAAAPEQPRVQRTRKAKTAG